MDYATIIKWIVRWFISDLSETRIITQQSTKDYIHLKEKGLMILVITCVNSKYSEFECEENKISKHVLFIILIS